MSFLTLNGDYRQTKFAQSCFFVQKMTKHSANGDWALTERSSIFLIRKGFIEHDRLDSLMTHMKTHQINLNGKLASLSSFCSSVLIKPINLCSEMIIYHLMKIVCSFHMTYTISHCSTRSVDRNPCSMYFVVCNMAKANEYYEIKIRDF